jgi:hypothetical protein
MKSPVNARRTMHVEARRQRRINRVHTGRRPPEVSCANPARPNGSTTSENFRSKDNSVDWE